jgi:hypothetical protein
MADLRENLRKSILVVKFIVREIPLAHEASRAMGRWSISANIAMIIGQIN